MSSTYTTAFETDPPVFMLKDLTVRALEKEEYARAGELLKQEHYLGDCPQGRQLLQVVEHKGRWVALLDWGPACWKLADRESYIGWTHQQRAERLGLIVQNRRFLVLGKERMPNLASRSLGLAIKGLRTHFQQHFTDPRRNNKSYHASSLLVFIAMALFAGREGLTAIQRYGNLLTGQQRAWLDFPFFTHTETPDTSHGRFDERTISVYPFEPIEAGLPAARSLAVIHRTHTGEPEEVPEVAYYITSHPPEKGCAPRFGNYARGHWGGCEIRNHWVRDHCMREDKTRSKNYKLNCALAGLRVCLISIKALLYPQESWPSIQERCQRDPSIAFRAIAKLRSK